MRRTFFALVLALALPTTAAATSFTYVASLSGPAENPPVASPGTGTAMVVYDDVAHTLAFDIVFGDLLAPTTVAHIHCCVEPPETAGVAVTAPTLPGFPAGVTSGTYVQTLDLTDPASFSSSFVTDFGGGTVAGAEAALAAGLASGQAYFNIHTSANPGGEIRGFLVPEPGTALLVGLGVALLGRRRARGHGC